jgi:glycosyltransferase involved in cell wall biosynthesis
VRLLVAPHELAIGGSQINAIDLAAGAAEAGHDVLVYGVEGPLVDLIEQRGLEFVPARPLRYRPAPSRIAQLASLARRRRLDLIHGYEWPPCLDAFYGAHLLHRVPLVCTVLSMSVSPLVPRSIPLIMGTEALGEKARRTHGAPVWVMEPPIDADADHPGIDGAAFRHAHGVGADELLIATVSRLAVDLKLDALVRAIDAADLLAGAFPVKLVLVGGGPADEPLRRRAAAVNARWGRDVVVFAGSLADPRPAYAAADVVVGMGSSALRAMSIGRPLVVQGERGFSKTFEPDAVPYFLDQGFWGLGDDEPSAALLAGQLRTLLGDADRRQRLGAFGRRMVEERFSLRRATGQLLDIYGEVLALRRRTPAANVVLPAMRALRMEVENHDPRLKRRRHDAEQAVLSAAGRPGAAGAEAALEAAA